MIIEISRMKKERWTWDIEELNDGCLRKKVLGLTKKKKDSKIPMFSHLIRYLEVVLVTNFPQESCETKHILVLYEQIVEIVRLACV